MAKEKPIFNTELIVGMHKCSYEDYKTKGIITIHRMEDYLGTMKTIEDIEAESNRNKSAYFDIKGFKNGIFFGSNFKFMNESRGRSSVKFNYLVDDILKVEFFISDIADMIHANDFMMNNFEGFFTFVKKGQNYGIKMISHEYMKANPQPYKTVSDLISELQFKETNQWTN